jgi:hypothetical protein
MSIVSIRYQRRPGHNSDGLQKFSHVTIISLIARLLGRITSTLETLLLPVSRLNLGTHLSYTARTTILRHNAIAFTPLAVVIHAVSTLL